MAFGFKFWHIPEHRVYHYEPRYYDERKEKLEELYKKYGKTMPGEEIDALAKQQGLTDETGKRYIPGMHIRGSFRRTYEEKRLSQAAWLLKNTDRKVDEIARLVGYENTSYFHRLFSARFSRSPKQYRDCK